MVAKLELQSKTWFMHNAIIEYCTSALIFTVTLKFKFGGDQNCVNFLKERDDNVKVFF
jgi:hypothetical protein